MTRQKEAPNGSATMPPRPSCRKVADTAEHGLGAEPGGEHVATFMYSGRLRPATM
jgi:hypothetical protein